MIMTIPKDLPLVETPDQFFFILLPIADTHPHPLEMYKVPQTLINERQFYYPLFSSPFLTLSKGLQKDRGTSGFH